MRLTVAVLASVLCAMPAWADDVLTAEGLGSAKIGMSRKQVEKALGARLKFQALESDACATADMPDRNGFFMFLDHRLARIDIDKRGVKTAEGAGVGMKEAELRKIYGRTAKFRVHPYGEEPNDHYVEVKLAKNRLLIFETMSRRVESFRVGTGAAAPLIEGCS